VKPADRKLVQEKLASLKDFVVELESSLHVSLAQFLKEKLRRRAVERSFQIVVECATDTNNLLLAATNRALPSSASESYRALHDLGALDEAITIRFTEHYVPKRNFIVHMYEKIEPRDLYYSARRLVKEAREYARQIQRFLDAQARSNPRDAKARSGNKTT
jgi:uncharacterized protein YutE (UPF0331/DUF86 family)